MRGKRECALQQDFRVSAACQSGRAAMDLISAFKQVQTYIQE